MSILSQLHVRFCHRLQPCLYIKSFHQDAIEADSYLAPESTFSYGKVGEAFASSYRVVEGECFIKGQRHFYMETQRASARPLNEDNEIEVIRSEERR